jgi:chromosome segregation ATPase
MSDRWYEDAAWDDPTKLSRDSGCDLKHFSSASRNFRDELNNKELKLSSNQDLLAIVRNSRYKLRDWWQYVDPAASRSAGHENSTAIVLWECESHVLTCRKIRGRWSLIPGHALDDLSDVTEQNQQDFRFHHDYEEVQSESFHDDELDDIISFMSDDDNHEEPKENNEKGSTHIHDDLEEEDTERSLLKLDRDLEKSSEIEQPPNEHDENLQLSANPPSTVRNMNQKMTNNQIKNFENQVETLTNKLHDSLDEIALLKHQIRIEKEHNLSLQQGKDILAKKYADLNSNFDSAVNEKMEAERRALRHQAEQLESRVEELKNIEKSRNIKIKQLSDEILRLKRDCAGYENEKDRLNYTIDRQKNEIIRLDLTIEGLTSKSEVPEDQPSADSNSSINAEMELLELSFQQALDRERTLLEQLATKTENSAQLERQVRDLSEEILNVQEENSINARENQELRHVLAKTITETTEQLDLAIDTERAQKSIEIHERDTAHQLVLSDINSRLDQVLNQNHQLNNQIAELEKVIYALEDEKKLNEMALAKLEEVISLLDKRLPEREVPTDNIQTFDLNPEVKQKKRLFGRNQ